MSRRVTTFTASADKGFLCLRLVPIERFELPQSLVRSQVLCPLSYMGLAGLTGFEPITQRLTAAHVAITPQTNVARIPGIEPKSRGLESLVLPLHHIRKCKCFIWRTCNAWSSIQESNLFRPDPKSGGLPSAPY
jgi:hypothetical protein